MSANASPASYYDKLEAELRKEYSHLPVELQKEIVAIIRVCKGHASKARAPEDNRTAVAGMSQKLQALHVDLSGISQYWFHALNQAIEHASMESARLHKEETTSNRSQAEASSSSPAVVGSTKSAVPPTPPARFASSRLPSDKKVSRSTGTVASEVPSSRGFTSPRRSGRIAKVNSQKNLPSGKSTRPGGNA